MSLNPLGNVNISSQMEELRSATKDLSSLARRGQWQRVHQLLYYEWTQRRLQRDAIAQSSLLGACARAAAWVSSLAALVDLEDVCDVVARGSAINACAKAKHWTHAVHLLRLKPWKRQMDTKKTNIICFNAALTGCQWYHTFQLVHLLRSEGLQADVISFNSVVAACGTKETSPTLKSTYWSRGLEALTSLFLQHLQATVVTMNSATNMCQKSGQWTVALSMSSKLQQSKLAVDSTSFTSVLTAIDHWSQCLECLEQHKVAVLATKGQRNTDEEKSHLGQMGTYSTIILNSALSSLATAWRHTLQLTQQTLFGEFGCSADTITLNTAASACANAIHWEHALMLLNFKRDVSRRFSTLQPDVFTYNTVLSACEKGQQWERAVQLLWEMDGIHLKPDTISFNAAVAACGAVWEMALDLVHQMENCKLQLDAVTYHSAIDACQQSQQWEAALALCSQMTLRRIQRDVISFSLAIRSQEKAQRWKQALDLFYNLSILQLQVNEITCGVTLGACKSQWQFTEFLLRNQELTGQPAIIRVWSVVFFLEMLCTCCRMGANQLKKKKTKRSYPCDLSFLIAHCEGLFEKCSANLTQNFNLFRSNFKRGPGRRSSERCTGILCPARQRT